MKSIIYSRLFDVQATMSERFEYTLEGVNFNLKKNENLKQRNQSITGKTKINCYFKIIFFFSHRW